MLQSNKHTHHHGDAYLNHQCPVCGTSAPLYFERDGYYLDGVRHATSSMFAMSRQSSHWPISTALTTGKRKRLYRLRRNA